MRITKIQHDPGPYFVVNKNTKICSEHFILLLQTSLWKLEDHVLNMMQPIDFSLEPN